MGALVELVLAQGDRFDFSQVDVIDDPDLLVVGALLQLKGLQRALFIQLIEKLCPTWDANTTHKRAEKLANIAAKLDASIRRSRSSSRIDAAAALGVLKNQWMRCRPQRCSLLV